MPNIKKDRKGLELISRDLIFDNTLSDRARFVYIYMMAKPDNWDFYLEPMAKEIGYSVETLRKYIKELINAGWLTKVSQSRAEKDNTFGACEYIIHEDKEGSRAINFPTREISDTEKTGDIDYIDNNNTEIKDKEKVAKATKKFDFRASVISLGVPPNIVDDWLSVRKTKRATNTETAFSMLAREVEKTCSLYPMATPEILVKIAVERNWMGIKCDFFRNINFSDYIDEPVQEQRRQPQLPLFDDSGEWQG